MLTTWTIKFRKQGIFSTKNKAIAQVFIILALVFLIGCRDEAPRVTLRQPFVAERVCVKYRFESGVWQEVERGPLESCDSILGVNFQDFEKLRQFYQRCERALRR